MESCRLKTTAPQVIKHQLMKNVACSMSASPVQNQIFALAIAAKPHDSWLRQAWLTSLKYLIYAHLCGELITLPVPQPMLYSYDFNFMAELNMMEGNEYV